MTISEKRLPAVLVQPRGVIDAVYYEVPFTFKNKMWAYTTDNKTTVKFLYYVLKNNVRKFRDAASGMGSWEVFSTVSETKTEQEVAKQKKNLSIER